LARRFLLFGDGGGAGLSSLYGVFLDVRLFDVVLMQLPPIFEFFDGFRRFFVFFSLLWLPWSENSENKTLRR
jgi:hypothetical protein